MLCCRSSHLNGWKIANPTVLDRIGKAELTALMEGCFHGLSHHYAARRGVEMAGGSSKIVTCHLGAGASLCAVLHGRSVDTTMGFTPLEGLVMATRSGSVDPGLVLWLVTEAEMDAVEVTAASRSSRGWPG